MDFLLEFLEVVFGSDFHEEEDEPWEDAAEPEEDFKEAGAKADLDGELAFDDRDVATMGVDGACEFVEFVCHVLLLSRKVFVTLSLV